MFCTHCGAPIEGNQKFCTQCGAPVDLNMTGEYDNPYHVNPDTVGDEDLAIIRGKGFWENFKYVITKKFATIEGRASRGEYFKFYSVSAVIFSLIWVVAAISANIFHESVCGTQYCVLCIRPRFGYSVFLLKRKTITRCGAVRRVDPCEFRTFRRVLFPISHLF